MPNNTSPLDGVGRTAIQEFQTTTNIKSKATKEFGLKVAKDILAQVQSAYFTSRNSRFGINRRLANGKMNLDEFKEYFDVKGDLKYLKLRFKAIMIVSTTISRMKGRWMQNNEKVTIKAEDMLSVKQKEDKYEKAEFVMNNKDLLAELEANSGVPMVEPDQFIPEDKEELDDWKQDEFKLEEEIKFETGINKVLNDCGWFDVIKDKSLTDSAEVGLIGCEMRTMRDGMISAEWAEPETLIYSDSKFSDFRDTTYRGRIISMKIIEIREEHPSIGEDTLFEIAQKSNQYRTSQFRTFDTTWYDSFDRPYDDWSVEVIRFYFKTSDRDGYQMKVTRSGTLMVDKKDKPPTDPKPNKTYIQKDKYSIYKGVYVRDTEIMLEWGLQKNLIRPQDPQEIGDCEFPISLYMYNMHNMRNLAIPEKIEEPVEQMILTRLKIQQIVAGMRRPGNAYNIDAMQELDLGLGEGNMFSPLELKKVSDQTGDFYFRGRDAEGNKLDFPITPMNNAEGLQQLQALIVTYNHHLEVLRNEIGSNEEAEGQSPKARVTTDNYNSSLQMNFNATDYMYDAYLWLMNDVAKKIGCLLYDSAFFGGKQYQEILKKDDVKGRIFSTKAKMMPTRQEIAELDAMIMAAVQANPNFVLYCNVPLLRRIAKENPKRAERLFYRAQKNAIKGAMDQAAQQSQMASKASQEAAVVAAQEQGKVEQMKAEAKAQEIQLSGQEANKTAVINLFATLFGKGVPLPKNLQPLSNAVIENIMLPIVVQNEQQKQQILQQMQQEQMAQLQAEQQQQMQPQQSMMQEQPMQ